MLPGSPKGWKTGAQPCASPPVQLWPTELSSPSNRTRKIFIEMTKAKTIKKENWHWYWKKVIKNSLSESWRETKTSHTVILLRPMKSGIVPQRRQAQTHVYCALRLSKPSWSSQWWNRLFQVKHSAKQKPSGLTTKPISLIVALNFNKKKNLPSHCYLRLKWMPLKIFS